MATEQKQTFTINATPRALTTLFRGQAALAAGKKDAPHAELIQKFNEGEIDFDTVLDMIEAAISEKELAERRAKAHKLFLKVMHDYFQNFDDLPDDLGTIFMEFAENHVGYLETIDKLAEEMHNHPEAIK